MKLGKQIALGSAAPLCLTVLLASVALWSVSLLTASNEWVDHTHNVISKAKEIEASAVNMETGMRGYLLAGQAEFLAPYNEGSDVFTKSIGELKETVSDNPAQVELLGEVEQTIGTWKELITEPMIALRKEVGDTKTMDDIAEAVSKSQGKQYFDKFREQIATFTGREKELMTQRQESAQQTANFAWLMIIGSTLAAIILSSGISWYLIRSITTAVKSTVIMLRDIAEGEGDLTKRLDENRSDELGELAKWFNVFIAKLQGIIGNLTQDAATLSNSSEELSKLASELSADASAASDKSASATSRAAEVSTNMNSMASSTEEMSVAVKTIATIIDELTGSIDEIARTAESTSSIVSNAATLSEQTQTKIGELEKSSTEIGAVIELIQEIADQTNLLALNATIESARAGEAGKGFAVVAAEVKELARQTTDATVSIRSKISGIQTTTREAVQSVAAIDNAIVKVNESSQTIAAAVEEQSAAVRNIATNMAQTTMATDDVAQRVNQSATVTEMVSSNVADVSEVLKRTSNSAQQAKNAGTGFREMAGKMREVFAQFKT